MQLFNVLCTLNVIEKYRDVAQFGSAPVLGTGSRRFESCHPETPLVQLVERRFPKPDVVGSSPTRRELEQQFCFIFSKKMPVW